MKITSKKSVGSMLPVGFHKAVLTSIEETQERMSDEGYVMDSQVCVTFKSENGSIKHWYNNAKFKRYVDLSDSEKKSKKYVAMGSEGYAVNKATKRRLVDVNDESCANIYANLAYACGVDEGEDIEMTDLIDSELVIEVVARTKGVEVKKCLRVEEYEKLKANA